LLSNWDFAQAQTKSIGKCVENTVTNALTQELESPLYNLYRLRANIVGGKRANDVFDLDWLTHLVTSNGDIDQLIGNLPREVRHDIGLAILSKSTQFAASDRPRSILTNSDSTWLGTFGGVHDKPGYHTFESVMFDRKTSEFIPYEIEPKVGGGLKITQKPERCSSCHGNPFRPIWAPYPSWERLLGGVHGGPYQTSHIAIEMVARENDLYEKFKTGEATQGRYRHLILPPDIKALHDNNSAISGNLVILKAIQLRKKLDEYAQSNPQWAKIGMRVIRNIAEDPKDSPLELLPLLDEEARALYKREFDKILSDTRLKIESQRARRINEHRAALGLPKLEKSQALSAETGIADSDFGISPTYSAEKNRKNFETAVVKFSNLRFFVENLMHDSLSNWGMSLDPRDIPMLAGPITSGWKYILHPTGL
jgi:hypothetical protein